MGTESTRKTNEAACLHAGPSRRASRPRCAPFVQLSHRCTSLSVILALALFGCDPHVTPPPVMPDGGAPGGVRLVVEVRVSIAGEPWESLEPPTLADDFRLEQLSLSVASARSPSDRVDLPVPQSSGATQLEAVAGPRDLELLGASPATYGRAVLELAPSAPGEPTVELRMVQGEVTYTVVSTRPLTIDARCGGEAFQLDPHMLGVLRLSLPAEQLVDVLRDVEPGTETTVRIDASTAPDVLDHLERILAEAWTLDCAVSPDELPMSPTLSAEPRDAP